MTQEIKYKHAPDTLEGVIERLDKIEETLANTSPKYVKMAAQLGDTMGKMIFHDKNPELKEHYKTQSIKKTSELANFLSQKAGENI